MMIPLTSFDYKQLSGKPAPPQFKGWCWYHQGKATAALPLSSLGGRDWGTEGLIGLPPDHRATAQLIQKALEDLKGCDARILIAFADLPGLSSAGTVCFYEAPGKSGELQLATEAGSPDDLFAQLVQETQKESCDFNEIPASENILEPYLGHGHSLWRRWKSQGVILVNAVDSLTCHLAFVGLTPCFRNRGHGLDLVEDALRLTGKNRRLTTAVDSRNLPAVKIYEQLGFTLTEKRPVRFRLID